MDKGDRWVDEDEAVEVALELELDIEVVEREVV